MGAVRVWWKISSGLTRAVAGHLQFRCLSNKIPKYSPIHTTALGVLVVL